MPLAFLSRTLKQVFSLILFGLLMAACGQASPEATAGPSINATSSASLTVQATATSAPLPSPTFSKPVVILVAPAQVDPYQLSADQAALTDLAASSGLDLRAVKTLAASDLDPSVKVVVALQTDPGLAGLAKGAPGVQFVAIGIAGLQAGANLSLIGPEGLHPDQQAFIAGYIAAILTFDWRAGVLSPAEADGGKVIQDAFSNGVRFLCGLCRPAHPPYTAYPQAFTIASPGDAAGWRSSADGLLHAAVTTVYVSPATSSPALLTYLYQAKVDLIGGQAPTDDLRSQWIATIHPDPTSALKQVWPDLIAGKGGAQLPMPIVLADTSSGLLDAARLRLVNATLDDLVNGRIQPNPVTGP